MFVIIVIIIGKITRDRTPIKSRTKPIVGANGLHAVLFIERLVNGSMLICVSKIKKKPGVFIKQSIIKMIKVAIEICLVFLI